MPRSNFASLEALSNGASSTRLLNLAAVATRHSAKPEYHARPFFETPMLNTALVLKHTPRTHEWAVFDRPPNIATKVVVPFDRNNLAIGGRSVFVGQKRWVEQLETLTNGARTLERDCEVLRALDDLPSLDPFLVREQLSRRGFSIAPCYLTILEADVERMRKTVAAEVDQLVGQAFAGVGTKEHTGRLAQLLLTDGADTRLEPLRLTLRLEGAAYEEGIFAWRGFLYYKWAADELHLRLLRVMGEIGQLKAETKGDPGTATEFDKAKRRLMSRIGDSETSAVEALRTYDDAFHGLVRRNEPSVFRDFLLSSPQMFLTLGEALGALSHIISYWSYRFPDGAPLSASGLEALEIIREFEATLPAVRARYSFVA
jgi:hypothetical protein